MSSIVWPEQSNRIPQEILIDEDVYQLEQERIFRGPTWHLVAHESELPNVGDYKTTDLGGVPLLIIRARDGKVGVLVNACAHRGCQVVRDRAGNARRGVLRCIYHAWTYDLAGHCTGASLPESFPEDFSKDDYGLPAVRSEVIAGCIFATLSDETPSIGAYFGEVKGAIESTVGNEPLVYLGSQRSMISCNWKLYSENNHDGYHAALLHAAYKMTNLKARGEILDSSSAAYAHAWITFYPDPPRGDVLRDTSVLECQTRERNECTVIGVFPMGVITRQMDSLNIRFFIPRAVDLLEVQFAYFAPCNEDAERTLHRARQGSNLWGPQGLIALEDAVALGRMQTSAHARRESVILKGAPKRFPPYRLNDEVSIRDFYASYRRCMGF